MKERSFKMRKKTCESTDSHVSTKTSTTSSMGGVSFWKVAGETIAKIFG